MHYKRSSFVFKLIWVVGLIGLLIIGHYFEQIIKQNIQASFNFLPQIWFNTTLPFLFGVYISILLVKSWSIKVNIPLFLCVTVPCLLISFYTPFVYTLAFTTTVSSFFNIPVLVWLLDINSYGIASIVAGLTLSMSLFGADREAKN
ncbi:hypothetical protein ACQKP0_15190 [Heyndrickxia sp. NPDC080065]|uniref:hypothetical protein n=1 Tax=Heyndrickxia sp. NPDC080065 TaxID=3390568 RepID=UPI003D020307